MNVGGRDNPLKITLNLPRINTKLPQKLLKDHFSRFEILTYILPLKFKDLSYVVAMVLICKITKKALTYNF